MLSFAIAVPPSELSDLIGMSAIPSLQNSANALFRLEIVVVRTKRDRVRVFGAPRSVNRDHLLHLLS